MKQTEHRAREQMLALGREIPGIWAAYEEARAEGDPREGIYITEADGAGAFAQALLDAQGLQAVEALRRMSPIELARMVSPITTMAAWRMTQGIYRFDPALYETLIETPLTGDLPAEVLLRLPEWCLYLETPGLYVLKRDGGRADLAGVWVRADHEPDGTPCLIITLDIPEAPRPESQTIVLRGSLEHAVGETMRQWGFERPDVEQAVADYLRPIVNLVLYLVGTDDVAGPHGAPGNPAPKRIRCGGERLFAAEGLRAWDVGVRMGAALRRAYHAAEVQLGGTHSGPRPHVRRAHWHSFWVGKIGAPERQLKPRWLPPIPVNLDDPDSIPAVIRPVKP